MRTTILSVFFLPVVAVFTGCVTDPKSVEKSSAAPGGTPSVSTNSFSSDEAKASYAVGMIFGHNLQAQGIDVDTSEMLRGLKDEQSGGATLLTPQQAQIAVREFEQEINKKAGEAFLATNKNATGVITLPDGLQYKVLTAGTGATPTPISTVTVNYRGMFLNGTEFDSSARVGHPVQFQAGRMIRGWTEALTQMKAGSKWKLFIPSGLAYGAQGRAGIPPNSTLIFEIELLDVQNPPASTQASAPAEPLTSNIVKVPSAEELKKGAKVEMLNPEEVRKLQSQTQTN